LETRQPFPKGDTLHESDEDEDDEDESDGYETAEEGEDEKIVTPEPEVRRVRPKVNRKDPIFFQILTALANS
jgi:hypothetical protein